MKENGGRARAHQVPVRTRSYGLFLSGAAGILLAALIYLVATRVGGAIGVLVPIHQAEIVIFLILLVASLLEMPLMLFGLNRMRAANSNSTFVHAVNILFVAFAAAYAAIQVLLFGESNFSLLLAGLSLARWGSSFAVV